LVILRRYGRADRRIQGIDAMKGLLARKAPDAEFADAPESALEDSKAEPAADGVLDLDEELFSALGAQLGGENESLRNLLLNANTKIGELESIKEAFDRLVNPVSKALRAIEAERSEKLALQTVLNNTRTAYGKLRNEATDLEKQAAAAESECLALRQELASTHNLIKKVEATKAEIAVDIAARRAQIVDLEARLAHEAGENKALRDENRRLDERLIAGEKRIIALESDLNGARQRLIISDDEKRAQQALLEKASAEAARLSRKLAETEASLAASQGRLRHVEANFAEINTERSRLATALDEANERHEHEMTSQRMRFEALQARAAASEKLLAEAGDHLLARAEEIREYDRRVNEVSLARDGLQKRTSELTAERIKRESEFRELEQARLALMERSDGLARTVTAKEATLARAEDTINSLHQRIRALEAEVNSRKQMAEELNGALRREKLERSVVEGALETARKDFARVMREVLAMQRQQAAQEAAPEPKAANAA
jgi:chromosome segregation ATPase